MKKAWPFYIIIFSLFLIIISPKQWADGMFLDGMIYASISKSMAIGLGYIWKPYYTALSTEFYEHPPLAFWLQSLFFRIIGDSIYVERFYSFFTFMITGGFMLLIWKRITGNLRYGWVSLLLWITIPTVFWACSNNMLENTMMVFTTLSVFFYIKKGDGFYFLILSGICVFLAFLSKGVFALFVLSIPFWLWIFQLEHKPVKVIVSGTILLMFTIAPFIVISLFEKDLFFNVKTYWFHQVVKSVQNVQTVSNRFKIVEKMFLDLLPSLIIAGVLIIAGRKRKIIDKGSLHQYKSWSLALLCLGLSGVLPIMVSLKQSAVYILATFPVFSLGIALYILPVIERLFERIQPVRWLAMARLSVVMLILSIFLSFALSGRIGRDHMEMKDLYATLAVIPRDSVISIPKNMSNEWRVYAMYTRYGQITPDPYHLHYFFITKKDNKDVPEDYHKIPLETFVYDLYKKSR